LLLGGASGVGKTQVSYRLARHYDAGLTEVDDFQIVLEHMTTPEQQPVLHLWRTRPEETRRMTEEQHVAFSLEYARVMATALEPVIANHIETRTRIVLEGDFILPSLAVRPRYRDVEAGARVQAVFLYEDDEAQIRRNYLEREGEEQLLRARVSWLVGDWLRREATRLGVPAVAARPWGTVLERVIAAVDSR